jgi:hypothetical protein
MAPTIFTELERKQTVQNVIDRLLYAPGYKEALQKLNEQYSSGSKIEPNGVRKFKNVTIVK